MLSHKDRVINTYKQLDTSIISNGLYGKHTVGINNTESSENIFQVLITDYNNGGIDIQISGKNNNQPLIEGLIGRKSLMTDEVGSGGIEKTTLGKQSTIKYLGETMMLLFLLITENQGKNIKIVHAIRDSITFHEKTLNRAQEAGIISHFTSSERKKNKDDRENREDDYKVITINING